ncbi:MAG: exodeoxyribonuclease VII large subunit [Chloroflexi bacterium]|nr:exodeoxyribonuclease VII large subunit [Chloroflexota bacterium]
MSDPLDPPDWALPAWDADRSATRPSVGGPHRDERAEGRSPADRQPPSLRILAVTDVTRAVRDAVRGDERLRDLWVEGEVGRVTISSAGHGYFNLKDERSQLACIWFREDRLASPFEARVGLRIVAHGRLDVFEPGGVYQLYVDAVQPAGFGDLAIRFEALKARLAAAGLFDAARKRPLPGRPAVVAVVTSATGAVWHDIVRVVERRWPLTRVILSPCLVQGDGSVPSIVHALERIDRWADRLTADGRGVETPTVTILARGGGSLEDLWSFNDEAVVRAVVGHGRPVVAAIGHETDVTLADFAADVRAPTPSAAAELVVPDRAEALRRVAALDRRGQLAAERRIGTLGVVLGNERRVLAGLHPAVRIAADRERSGALLDRATAAAGMRVERSAARLARSVSLIPIVVRRELGGAENRLMVAAAALGALGPQATLERGYAIVRRIDDARILRVPTDAPPGTGLTIRLAHGDLAATAGPRFRPRSGAAGEIADP